jgi:hypothetical protein
MTDRYRLVVRVVAEPVKRSATEPELDALQARGQFFEPWDMPTIRDYSRAAGTYVEVENAGEVCNVDATELTVEVGALVLPMDLTVNLQPEQPSPNLLRLELPWIGRPIVLLAVGGGNQVFDHWDAESSICVGQGARCEVPEPAADFQHTLYAKAVFRTKDPEDIRVGELDGRQTRHKLTVDPFREP